MSRRGRVAPCADDLDGDLSLQEADRRLGFAMLERGRLRSALQQARRHAESRADAPARQFSR